MLASKIGLKASLYSAVFDLSSSQSDELQFVV